MGNRVLTQEQKEALLAQALATPEGRVEIGQTMLEPFKKGRDYRSIGRKIMAVDILPTAAPMWYDKDPQFSAVTMAQNGAAPYEVLRGERVELEPFAIVTWVKVPALEVAVRRFPILDRAQEKGRIEMAKEEDRRIFAAIEYAAKSASGHNTVVGSSSGLTRNTLADLFLQVEQYNAPVVNVIMHPNQYRDIRCWGRDELDPVTQYELLRTGYVGDLWNARIRTSFLVTAGDVYVVAEPQYFGVISVRVDLNVWEAPDPQLIEYGWLFFEYIGVAAIIVVGCAKAEITGQVS